MTLWGGRFSGELDPSAWALNASISFDRRLALQDVDGSLAWARALEKAGVLSFVVDGVHPHDVGTILDQEGIAIRTGHHCAQPVMDRFDVPATVRMSLGLYNTREEVDAFVKALARVQEIFRA